MDLEVKEKLLKKHWFPPQYVLHAWNTILDIFGVDIINSDTDLKKVQEMKATSIMMLGIYKNLGFEKYFMQGATEKEQFPDTFTIYQTEHPVETKWQTIEVVGYGDQDNRHIDVGQFILETKLVSKKKAYDEDTIILCNILKDNTQIDYVDIFSKLSSAKFKPTRVYVVGNLHDDIWRLSQVWPTITHVNIDVVAEANNYPEKRPFLFRLGKSETFDVQHHQLIPVPNAFEIFGLDESKLRARYNK